MQEAKILHIEDKPRIRESIELLLAENGLHRVIGAAESYPEALKSIRGLERRRIRATVILMDGNLNGGMGINHPKMLLSEIKNLGLNIPVIGYSADGLTDKGVTVGHEIGKIVADFKKGQDEDLLLDLLNELPEQSSLVKS